MKFRVKKIVFIICCLSLSSCQMLPNQEEQAISLRNANSPDGKMPTKLAFLKAKKTGVFRQNDNSGAEHQLGNPTSEQIASESETKFVNPPAHTKMFETANDPLISNGSLPYITPSAAAKLNVPASFVAEDIIKLDYEQVELRQILQELADALGLSIVIDPSISGKITMRTSPQQPLKQKDLWPVLNMLLNESGISLEQKAGIYYVKKSAIALPNVIAYPSLIEKTNPSLAMQLTPLQHISSDDAMRIIKPLLGNSIKISQLSQLNMLAITASSEQLSRLNGLISLIDVDSFKHRGIRLYKIKDADAKSIAKELQEVLKLVEGVKSSYQVLGLERINAVLVVAPPKRGFKAVERWISILDEGTDHSLKEQIFIYRCKNVKCETLAATLNSIFNQQDKTVKNTINNKKTSENAPNVFRAVPKDTLNINAKNNSVKAKKTVVKEVAKNADNHKSADIDVTIVADTDTNALIVRTTGKDYRSLLETIKLLDRTPLQVLVNVVLAQVSLDKSNSLGLDWKMQTTNGLMQSNLGKASVVASGKPLGLVMSGIKGNLTASINALASSGDVNILSRPSLLISNNQEGVIKVGQEVPVQTSSTSNLNTATTTLNSTQVTQEISYRNTGIELIVTPHINEDGVITMEISQSLSAIAGTTNSQDASFKPTFTNQDLTTTAIVADGETIILGGLIDSVKTFTDTGLPILKDIPLFGLMFKTQEESVQRRELMLIITPRIIGPDTDLNEFGQQFMARFTSLGAYMDQELDGNY